VKQLCEGEYAEKDRDECVGHVCELIEEKYMDEWEKELQDVTGFTDPINNIIIVSVTMLQESMEMYEMTKYVSPYEILSNATLSEPDMVFLRRGARTKKTVQDIVNCMYDMSEDDIKYMVKGIQGIDSIQDVICFIIRNIKMKNMNDEAGKTPDVETSEDTDDENTREIMSEKILLEETILHFIHFLHLEDVLYVDVRMNANKTRKGDPHDIAFFYKSDSPKITGKKSWRSYVKTFAKRKYSEDLEHIRNDVKDNGIQIQDGVDSWVYITCYIIMREYTVNGKPLIDNGGLQKAWTGGTYTITKQDIDELPKRTVDDVIKTFSKIENEEDFQAIMKDIATKTAYVNMYPAKKSKSFFRIVYEALWGDVRTRHHTDPGPSSPKPMKTKKGDNDIPTQASQKKTVSTPKKSPRPSPVKKRGRGRPRKTDTEQKKTKKPRLGNQSNRSRVDAAAEVLSQMSSERPGKSIPPDAVITNGIGCIITIGTFTVLTEQLCGMYGVSLSDFTSYMVSGNPTGPVTGFKYLGVFSKLCQCLSMGENPLDAAIRSMTAVIKVDPISQREIEMTPMDVVVFFIDILVRGRITNRIAEMKRELDDEYRIVMRGEEEEDD